LYIGKARYLINLLQRPKFIIAENNESIIGFATISNFTLNHLYSFSWLCVEPAYRNQGVGRLIVTAADEYTKQQQSGFILTTAIPAFFRALGFEISTEFKPGWFLMATKVDL
jgi:N-acetylglutamate synthase-like GNAT family acetyltransferase